MLLLDGRHEAWALASEVLAQRRSPIQRTCVSVVWMLGLEPS